MGVYSLDKVIHSSCSRAQAPEPVVSGRPERTNGKRLKFFIIITELKFRNYDCILQ